MFFSLFVFCPVICHWTRRLLIVNNFDFWNNNFVSVLYVANIHIFREITSFFSVQVKYFCRKVLVC